MNKHSIPCAISALIVLSAENVSLAEGRNKHAESKPTTKTPNRTEELRQEYILLYQGGNFGAAIPVAKQACSQLSREFGENTLDFAVCQSDLALLYQEQGSLETAEILYQEALSIFEDLENPDPLELSACLSNLGQLRQDQGRPEEAEPLLLRALTIDEDTLGSDHADVARKLNNLGALYAEQGLLDKAELTYARMLAIYEKQLDTESSDYAIGLDNAGSLYAEQGDFDEAERLYLKSLSIKEKTLNGRHPNVANSFSNLATLYVQNNQRHRAKPLYERAAAIYEDSLGSEHPLVANCLNSLAVLYEFEKDYETAEKLLARAITIQEKNLGPDHFYISSSLNNLATVHLMTGHHNKAEPLYQRALSIRRRTLGQQHPDVAYSLHRLGLLYSATKRHDLALEFHGLALEIEEKNLISSLAIADESRRLAYASTLSWSTHQAISLHLQLSPTHQPSAEIALTTIFRRKGRIQDLATQSYATLRRVLPEERQHLLDDLSIAHSKYASWIQRGPKSITLKEFFAKLETLRETEMRLWTELAQEDVAARANSEPLTITDISRSLPPKAILIEFVKYRPHYNEHGQPTQAETPFQYAAYIVSRDHFEWVSLGPATLIDNAANKLINAIARKSDARPASRTLYDLLMKPIVTRLFDEPTRLFIAPDGNLALIPFGALIDEHDDYLTERFHLHYLTSGRDLLRERSDERVTGGVVVVANPTGADLPGTEHEASVMTSLFNDAITVQRNAATEGQLRTHKRPRILHLATHGFFATGYPGSIDSDTQSTDDLNRSGSIVFDGLPDARPNNPMLYSWLHLAIPSNRSDAATLDDGRLTAYEISGWDLRGTELVTLSACDTGQGTYQQGEGILGLRRAFAIAGAQTQVMSLWKVSDTSTAKLMESYYRRLLAGEGRSEAMRNTQLEMLRNPETSHPRDWAAFVVVGEWGPLSFVDPPAPAEPDPIAPHPRGCQASTDTAGDHLTSFVLLPLLAFARRRREPQRHH